MTGSNRFPAFRCNEVSDNLRSVVNRCQDKTSEQTCLFVSRVVEIRVFLLPHCLRTPGVSGDTFLSVRHSSCRNTCISYFRVWPCGYAGWKPRHSSECQLQTSCRNTGYFCFRIAPVVGLRCRFSSKAHCSCDRSTDGVRLLCWLPCRAEHWRVVVPSPGRFCNGARYVRP